jgi:cell shape-determining protein MreC
MYIKTKKKSESPFILEDQLKALEKEYKRLKKLLPFLEEIAPWLEETQKELSLA